ncbi:MAG: hypothetical protein Kow0026_16470 [Oricola sp.]
MTGISGRLFVIPFIPGPFVPPGVFFRGVNLPWRTAIENREARRRAGG